MTKIIVHMGLHRTATTTVQARLRTARAELAAAGTALILREDMKQNRKLDMRKWHKKSLLGKVRKVRKSVQSFALAVERLKADTVIVSEENLIGTMPGVKGGGVKKSGFYPHYSTFIQSLQQLDTYEEVYPRLVLRRQDHFLESVYAFRVARGLTIDFPEFINSFGDCDFSWQPFKEALKPFGDRAQIAMLEDWGDRSSLARKALAFIGASVEEPAWGGGNQRLGENGTHLILVLNRLNLLMDMKVRKQTVFPIIAEAEKSGNSIHTCLANLSLTKVQTDLVKKHLVGGLQVSFTEKERGVFLNSLSLS